METDRVLVPVDRSVTLRQTVGYAVQSALKRTDDPVEIHFVYVASFEDITPDERDRLTAADRLLDRVEAWAREDADDSDRLTIETAIVGTEAYLFSPGEYAERLETYLEEHDLDRIVLDPEFQPGARAPMLQPIEARLEAADIPFTEAPVEPRARRNRFVSTATVGRFFALFAISFGFYLVLGDPSYEYDLVTGVISALIVSTALSTVTFSIPPHPTQSPLRVAKLTLYVPYLVWEIVKSNVLIAYVILHPSLPIDPRLTRVRVAVWGGLPLTTLANSITLTPGTLTVRGYDRNLVVHTLIPAARDGLFDGGLERAVRFVFYGRSAARIPSPRDRGDVEVLGSLSETAGDRTATEGDGA